MAGAREDDSEFSFTAAVSGFYVYRRVRTALVPRARAYIYIQLIVPRPLPVRVCVRLHHGGHLEAG